MDSIYMIIEITKALQDEKETIYYSILKNDKYGIKVTKALKNNINNEEIIMRDILNNEEDAKKLIESLVESGTDFSQIQYVVEDFNKSKDSTKLK
ncbi:MAG: hypothetical protein IKG14_05930 [Clostridia bacterium]|nr:hypothetical protein [Clostridia bacterium]